MRTRHQLRILPAVLALAALLAGCSSEDDPAAPGGGGNGGTDVNLAATKDLYVSSNNPTTNYGQNAVLYVGGGRVSYLQFDLTSLPADAVVTGFMLHLTQTAAPGPNAAGSVQVTYTLDNWEEDALVYDDAPDAYNLVGDIPLEALASGTRELAWTSDAGAGYARNKLLHENGLLSLRLTSGTDMAFQSDESPDTNGRPRLHLTYAEGQEIVLEPVADVPVHTSSSDTNLNDEPLMRVDRSYGRVFLRFDLSALPAGATIRRAQLDVLAGDGYAWGGDGNVYTRYVSDDTWDETTMTWNNQPAADASDLGHWWLWYDTTDRDAWGRNRDARLTGRTSAEFGGDKVLSLRLDSPGYRTDYYPREDADAAKHPRLTLLITTD